MYYVLSTPYTTTTAENRNCCRERTTRMAPEVGGACIPAHLAMPLTPLPLGLGTGWTWIGCPTLRHWTDASGGAVARATRKLALGTQNDQLAGRSPSASGLAGSCVTTFGLLLPNGSMGGWTGIEALGLRLRRAMAQRRASSIRRHSSHGTHKQPPLLCTEYSQRNRDISCSDHWNQIDICPSAQGCRQHRPFVDARPGCCGAQSKKKTNLVTLELTASLALLHRGSGSTTGEGEGEKT